MSRGSLSHRVCEVIGVALFALALIWLIGLASYDPADPVWFFRATTDSVPTNFAGRVGAFLSEASFQIFGFSAYLIPAMLAVTGWHYFWCRTLPAPATKATGAVVLVGSVATLLGLAFETTDIGGRSLPAGGYVGNRLAAFLADYLNRTGSIICVVTLLFLALIAATQLSFGQVFSRLANIVADGWRRIQQAIQARIEDRRRERQRREVIKKHLDKGTEPEVVARAERQVAAAKARSKRPTAADEPIDTPTGPEQAQRKPERPIRVVSSPPLPLPDPEPVKAPAERRKGEFTLPPLALLDAPRVERKIDERELMEAARLLEDKCREFAVEGSVVQIHPGPVVTTYEFKPDAGVKYSKITGLAEDLCLAMQAESVLIDRMPGKATVGIQIPNVTREQISLRELLESEVYRRSGSKLTMVLGKTIHGEPYMADLATMPHLLIAGATGTGKSVGLNAMLTSVLYRATPDDVRLILIDPKRLELGMYEDLPHLLTPVVVDPKQAANALRWAVREMEQRLKTLAAAGVRNIDQYNRNIRHAMEHATDTDEDREHAELSTLPFIIVVIDELADLIMVASNDVEEAIARLAQMARAVGIHLILATQRPSVDVITGLIKANFPARISFRVSTRVDSKVILDTSGAEQLLGRGDMLFLPPASSRLTRLHGAYISEQETARLASFLRKQGRPVFDSSITEDDKPSEAIAMERDEMYDRAARVVVETQQASISYLQRRLSVGFSRAARLIDMMEAEGIVSAAVNGRPREVLVPKDYFAEIGGGGHAA